LSSASAWLLAAGVGAETSPVCPQIPDPMDTHSLLLLLRPPSLLGSLLVRSKVSVGLASGVPRSNDSACPSLPASELCSVSAASDPAAVEVLSSEVMLMSALSLASMYSWGAGSSLVWIM
jgi:hypothetical protein